MNLIIPMGGQGKRLRPHTLTVPKPLLPIAGKPVVERIIEEIVNSIDCKIEKIGFIVSDLTDEIKQNLIKLSSKVNSKPFFFHQSHPLGTAHAIYCAKDLLKGNVMITFSDTLFKTKFKIDNLCEGIIWTKKVENPSAFGVVTIDNHNKIKKLVEKPKNHFSNLAMVGIYYFKEGEILYNAIKYIIENDIRTQGEYQLTFALKGLIDKGVELKNQNVDEWLDCGNKDSILNTHKHLLKNIAKSETLIDKSVTIHDSIIIPPVFIGADSIIHNSVIGPYVSIGSCTSVYDSRIQNSIVQSNSNIKYTNLKDAMMGSYVNFIGKPTDASIGDYSSTIIN